MLPAARSFHLHTFVFSTPQSCSLKHYYVLVKVAACMLLIFVHIDVDYNQHILKLLRMFCTQCK